MQVEGLSNQDAGGEDHVTQYRVRDKVDSGETALVVHPTDDHVQDLPIRVIKSRFSLRLERSFGKGDAICPNHGDAVSCSSSAPSSKLDSNLLQVLGKASDVERAFAFGRAQLAAWVDQANVLLFFRESDAEASIRKQRGRNQLKQSISGLIAGIVADWGAGKNLSQRALEKSAVEPIPYTGSEHDLSELRACLERETSHGIIITIGLNDVPSAGSVALGRCCVDAEPTLRPVESEASNRCDYGGYLF
jgi:hypothetical protein